VKPCGPIVGRALAQRVVQSDSGPFLVIRVSPGSTRFDPKSVHAVHVEFVVDKVALEEVLLSVLRFSAVNFIPPKLHLSTTVSRKTNSGSLRNLPTQPCCCGYRRSIGQQCTVPAGRMKRLKLDD
jgi:hypothetical protein